MEKEPKRRRKAEPTTNQTMSVSSHGTTVAQKGEEKYGEEKEEVVTTYPILHSELKRRAVDLKLLAFENSPSPSSRGIGPDSLNVKDFHSLRMEVKRDMESRFNLYMGDMLTPQEKEGIAPPVKLRGKRERVDAILSRDVHILKMLHDEIQDALHVNLNLLDSRDCGMRAPGNIVYKLRVLNGETNAHALMTRDSIRIFQTPWVNIWCTSSIWILLFMQYYTPPATFDTTLPLIAEINGYEGYFPHAIYEGNRMGERGEVLLIFVGYREKTNSHSYILIMGGYADLHLFQTREPITAGIYGVCSGGDPGCMYAVNSESIFDVYANEMQWKRDQSFEKKFEIGDEDIAKLVDTYLNTNESCGNRAFGYHTRPKELNEQGIEYKTIPGIVSIRISKLWSEWAFEERSRRVDV